LEAMKNEVKKREELLAEERRLRLQQEQQLRARNPQDAEYRNRLSSRNHPDSSETDLRSTR
jgi:hypothetical protein